MNINEVEHVISCFFIATLNEKDKNFVSSNHILYGNGLSKFRTNKSILTYVLHLNENG